MIKCIAVDDEPMALEVIRNHISRVDFLSLEETFTDPYKAISYVNDHEVDLVFLDISMPGINGMQLSTCFTRQPYLIFTTAHSEYALASYELKAIDYLLKPFDFPRFLAAANKVKERMSETVKSAAEFFFVNTGNQRQRIFYKEITHIKGDGNYVTYYTAKGKILVRASMSETAVQLPASMFVQIHRSTIVALQWIEKIEDQHVYIEKERLPVSATYRDKFMDVVNSLQK
ncbi:MAG: response regulator transcription factor [Chitinophagaceae bacterium]|nr:response regulator transcription factor [Chitinophagaceae bacterium]